MKTTTKLLTCLALLACSLPLTNLRAQDGPPPPPPPGQGEARGAGHGMRGDRLKAMAEALGLSEAQKEQLKPIFIEEAKALKAIRDDSALSKEEKMAKAKAVREEFKPRIRANMTPEQIEKLKSWEKKQRERGGERGPKGPPPPPPADSK